MSVLGAGGAVTGGGAAGAGCCRATAFTEAAAARTRVSRVKTVFIGQTLIHSADKPLQFTPEEKGTGPISGIPRKRGQVTFSGAPQKRGQIAFSDIPEKRTGAFSARPEKGDRSLFHVRNRTIKRDLSPFRGRPGAGR